MGESERDSSSGSGSRRKEAREGSRRRRTKTMSAGAAWRKLVSTNLKELRFHFSQTSQGSKGLRDFVQTNYKDLKTVNPTFPFLVRECEGIEAKIWARYELGVEKSISVEGLDVANVEKSVQQLVKEKPT